MTRETLILLECLLWYAVIIGLIAAAHVAVWWLEGRPMPVRVWRRRK
jgi:hypothetical protein